MPQDWWSHSTKETPLICVYCAAATTGTEHLEHVIPEALGHKTTLYPGAVCTECNNRLGTKVEAKMFREPMMAAGQVATGAEGKRGARRSIGRHVSKTDTGVRVDGGDCGRSNEFAVSRAIAKAGVNIVTHHFGSVVARERCTDLIDYVRQPKTRTDIWPYVAVFTPVGCFGDSFGLDTLTVDQDRHATIEFVCSSGVFAALIARHVSDGADLLHDKLMEQIKKAIVASGKSVPLMSYVGK